MSYFLIRCSEDGDIYVSQYAAGQMESNLNDPDSGYKIEEFVDKLPDCDPNYWKGKMILIKGEIVVPKVKEVATRVTLE